MPDLSRHRQQLHSQLAVLLNAAWLRAVSNAAAAAYTIRTAAIAVQPVVLPCPPTSSQHDQSCINPFYAID
jgi:hypothetical protein